MEVIATAKGYYLALREPGDKFEVPDDFKSKWFEPTDSAKAEKKGSKAEKKADA